MRQIIQGTPLSAIMSQHSCDTSVALEKLRDMITTYTPRSSMSYRTKEAEVEYLQNALAAVEWAKQALKNATHMNLYGRFIHCVLLSIVRRN